MRPSACAASVRALQSVLFAHRPNPRNSRGARGAGARRLGDEQALQRRQPVDDAQAEVARQAQRREIVGEQPVQRVHAEARCDDVEAARALVGLERRRVARIEAEAHALGDDLGERGDVAQAEIEPLPRQRMHDVGGVGDERDALARRSGARSGS